MTAARTWTGNPRIVFHSLTSMDSTYVVDEQGVDGFAASVQSLIDVVNVALAACSSAQVAQMSPTKMAKVRGMTQI